MKDQSRVTDAVRESFGQAACTYAVHANVQEAMADWLAEWLPTDRSGTALELGAGTGGFTRRLLPWAGDLTATDLAAAMCEEAAKKLPAVNWKVMRAEAPSGGPYDWIFTSSMLQWATDPAAMFSAGREVLKPGGQVLAGLFAAGSLAELESLMDGSAPLTWRGPEVWSEALASGGLRVVKTDTVTRVFYYASALDLLRSLHGVGAAPIQQLNPGRLRRLLRDYDARFRDERGVRATWVFHRFVAEQRD